MAERIHIPVFDPGECLTQDELLAFQSGQLPAELRHRVEKHLLDCEWCAEAVEGLQGESPAVVQNAVNDITDRAWKRVSEIERRRKRGAWIWISSSAATVLLVIGLFFLNRNDPTKKAEEAFSQAFDETPLPAPSAEEEQSTLKSRISSSDEPDKKSDEKSNENIKTVPSKSNILFDMGPLFEKEAREDIAMNKNLDFDSDEVSVNETPVDDLLKNDRKAPGLDYKSDASLAGPSSDSVNTVTLNSTFGTGNYSGSVQSVPATPFFSQSVPVEVTKSYQLDHVASDNSAKKDKAGNLDVEVETAGKNKKTESSNKPKAGNTADFRSAADPAPKGNVVAGHEESKAEQNRDANVFDDESADVVMMDSTVSGGTISIQRTEFEKALERHNAKDHQAALGLFENLSKKNPTDMESRLYSGINYLALNQPANAIFRLNEVINGGNARQQEDARWYRALTYLKLKDVATAKTQLREISTAPGRYQKKASDTLKTLE